MCDEAWAAGLYQQDKRLGFSQKSKTQPCLFTLESIVEDLKPSEKLLSSMSLEAFRAWSEQFSNFTRQNVKALEKQGLETARAYLPKAIDKKLSTRHKIMLDMAGLPKVTRETFMKEILKLLEDLYLKAQTISKKPKGPMSHLTSGGAGKWL